jgi:hypothetical protein
MIRIAHRGNLNGKATAENQPEYVMHSLRLGFDAEVDVWFLNNNLWAGHDSAKYLLNNEFLNNDLVINHVWFHCKNLEALNYFIDNEISYKFFWHQNDNYALTSDGFIWTYPGKPVTKNNIIVDFNNDGVYEVEPYGICSDCWNID